MKRFLLLGFILALATSFACAQQTTTPTTTLTVTQDSCFGKANQLCFNIPVVDQWEVDSVVTIDTRIPSGGSMQYNLYLGPWAVNGLHGTYSGFVANPNGTHAPFTGLASFLSDDGTVEGQFYFDAKYVATCPGRGCGGTLGWHYRILAGSTINVQ